MRTAWRFQPSTQLGGDAFGYHWLDEQRLAIYLLDVCGHGVTEAELQRVKTRCGNVELLTKGLYKRWRRRRRRLNRRH